MPTEKPTSNYDCSQGELYAICRIGWASYLECVADFADFSGMYNAAYGTAAMAKLNAAAQMPDVQARNAVTETAVIKMKGKAADAIRMWDRLRRHIVRAWAVELVKPQTEAAGLSYRRAATRKDWEACMPC